MTFEKTKAVEHTAEEVAEEVKSAEETAPEAPQSEEQTPEVVEDTTTNEVEAEPEESVETLKERLAKVERDRDNYKQGMLSEKAKKRTIEAEESDDVDLNEQVVMEVLGKQSEKTALRNTIDTKHSDYIPELVDDANYQEIISYLPRNMDKSDYGSIVKSLKVATRLWKEEKGIKEPAKKVNIPSPKTTQAKESKSTSKTAGRKIISKSSESMDSWYK